MAGLTPREQLQLIEPGGDDDDDDSDSDDAASGAKRGGASGISPVAKRRSPGPRGVDEGVVEINTGGHAVTGGKGPAQVAMYDEARERRLTAEAAVTRPTKGGKTLPEGYEADGEEGEEGEEEGSEGSEGNEEEWAAIQQLQNDYAALRSEHNTLKQEYDVTKGKVERMSSDMATLRADVNSLKASSANGKARSTSVAAASSMESRLKALEDELAALKRAQQSVPAPVHEWPSSEAATTRPTSPQLDHMLSSLHDMCSNESNLEAAADVLAFTHHRRTLFLDGKLTVDISATGIRPRILWQLYALAVLKRPLIACMPTLGDGDAVVAIEYSEPSVVSCNSTPAVYFTRSGAMVMPPPPAHPLMLPGPGGRSASASSVTPAPIATNLTPGFGAWSLMSPSPAGMHRCASAMSVSSACDSPSFASQRASQSAVDTYTHRWGEPPSADDQASGRAFHAAFVPVKPAVEAAEHAESRLSEGQKRTPRSANALVPDWTPSATAAEPVDSGGKCAKCDKRGILTNCHGCGKAYHFDCCDPERQPPGGTTAWYCGQVETCKTSHFMQLMHWRPNPVPVETFDCAVCYETCPASVLADLIGCECKTKQICVGCAHKEIVHRRQPDDTVPCPLCKCSVTAIQRPGNGAAQTFGDLDTDDDDGDSPEAWRLAVRARRHRTDVVTEQRRMQTEAEAASRHTAALEAIRRGNVDPESAGAMVLAAQGDLAPLVDATGPIDSDRGTSAKMAAACSAPGARGRRHAARAAKEGEPPDAIFGDVPTCSAPLPLPLPAAPAGSSSTSPNAQPREVRDLSPGAGGRAPKKGKGSGGGGGKKGPPPPPPAPPPAAPPVALPVAAEPAAEPAAARPAKVSVSRIMAEFELFGQGSGDESS